jgi:prepilin-type N-terminal cleavage/methylation domain-containing protein
MDSIGKEGAVPSKSERRAGFTLIELLIVVVIIGLLAAIAVPKFGATKDKASIASIKSDLRNVMSSQEAYYVDYLTYTASLPSTIFQATQGNTVVITADPKTFTATATNSSITAGINQCTVTVGAGLPTDGVITCS